MIIENGIDNYAPTIHSGRSFDVLDSAPDIDGVTCCGHQDIAYGFIKTVLPSEPFIIAYRDTQDSVLIHLIDQGTVQSTYVIERIDGVIKGGRAS